MHSIQRKPPPSALVWLLLLASFLATTATGCGEHLTDAIITGELDRASQPEEAVDMLAAACMSGQEEMHPIVHLQIAKLGRRMEQQRRIFATVHQEALHWMHRGAFYEGTTWANLFDLLGDNRNEHVEWLIAFMGTLQDDRLRDNPQARCVAQYARERMLSTHGAMWAAHRLIDLMVFRTHPTTGERVPDALLNFPEARVNLARRDFETLSQAVAQLHIIPREERIWFEP